VATHVWVDDGFKALQAQGFRLPPKQKHQKATLALLLLLQGQDLATKTTLKAYFPSLPHLSRFYRVLQKAQGLLAYLAIGLSGGEGLLQVVDQKPLPWPTATGCTASSFLRPPWGWGPWAHLAVTC
jgi:hypothetical protein